VQQRGRERRERHQAEQHERAAGNEEAIQRVSGVDGREGDRGAGRREDARNMRGRDVGEPDRELAPPRPFAGRDQAGGEQAAKEHAHLRAEQAGLDRVLHQEDAAERERETADPDDPTRAEALLEAFRRLGGFRRLDRRSSAGDGPDRGRVHRGRFGRFGENLKRGSRDRRRRGGHGAGLGRRLGGWQRRRATQRDTAIEQRDVMLQRHHASAHTQDQDEGDDRHHGSNEVHENLPARVARTQFHACVAADVNLVQK
jgi:hypothetical protein